MSRRVALVTGAGSPIGIGYAAALALAQSDCAVVLAGLSERVHERVHTLNGLGFAAVAFAGDLTDPTTVGRLVALAGPVDILVNNAGMAASGVIDAQHRVADLPLPLWHGILARNLTSAFLVTQAVLPGMVQRGYGRVVNISSTTGAVAGVAGDAAYAAAKAGLLGFTRSLALEVAQSGITVNAVAPGWIATGSQTESERLAGLATPIGRSGQAAEVAAAIAFLASAGASYITGQLLVVDGGNAIMECRA